MGDAAGVGPEIVARLFAETPDLPAFVIGDPGQMRRAVELVGLKAVVEPCDGPVFATPGVIPVLAVADLPADLPYGRIDARAGRASYDAVVEAARLALAGAVSAIVTAPLHKEALRAAGASEPGHTEILADAAGTDQFGMMLATDELRVVLVSIHISLTEAIRRVTRAGVLRTIRLAQTGAQVFGIERPRIAVAGLNPHAGEGGLMGREELEIIAPAIADARAEGFDASGPWPPDTVFMRARQGQFDIVVAQYHDQGLIPIKYMGLETGVNVTVGLPFVRTSVDHGTAFDIAGKGVADARSLGVAFRLAVRMAAVSENREVA